MKNLIIILATSAVIFSSSYDGSTTSAVTLVGGIIKSSHIEPSDKKYRRKDCPVCKGTGKYLSGDGIKMVDCGYCEVEKADGDYELVHPPVIIYGKQKSSQPQCTGPNCRLPK